MLSAVLVLSAKKLWLLSGSLNTSVGRHSLMQSRRAFDAPLTLPPWFVFDTHPSDFEGSIA